MSSDKSPAGSTSLREEGKPQQCRTGGRGRLESGGRGAGRFTSGNEGEASRTPHQDADLCDLCILRYKQRSGCTRGSLARRSSRVSTATGASLLFPATLDAARL